MSDIPPFQRRKSRSGTRSRACPKKSDMPRYKFHAKKLTSRTEVPKRNPQYVGKKQTCPVTNSTPTWRLRYLARRHAADDVSITNNAAVADYFGHWLHRAQVSLLTGEISQIKLSHIRKKPWCGPGAGLARAWCGPGAGLARAWCGPGGVVVSNTPTPNHKETSPNGRNATPRPKPRSRRFAEYPLD